MGELIFKKFLLSIYKVKVEDKPEKMETEKSDEKAENVESSGDKDKPITEAETKPDVKEEKMETDQEQSSDKKDEAEKTGRVQSVRM